MSKAQSIVGASLKVYINNRIFGIANGFEWTTSSGRRAIFGLDNVNAIELAPASNSVTGKIECIRVRLDGGLEGRGISARDEDIQLEKYISITLIDRLTDTVIFRCDNAAVQQQTWRVDAKQLLRGNFSFIGIDWTNEVQN